MHSTRVWNIGGIFMIFQRGWDYLDLYLNWHVVNNPPVLGYICIYIYIIMYINYNIYIIIYIYLLSHIYIYRIIYGYGITYMACLQPCLWKNQLRLALQWGPAQSFASVGCLRSGEKPQVASGNPMKITWKKVEKK